MLTSTHLVARIERAECGLLRESVEAVARRHPGRNAGLLAVGGGVAAFSGEGSPLNKVAGLGFEGAVNEVEMETVERFYLQRGCPVQIELSSHADAAIAPMLTARGYQLVGFEDVLGRDLSALANTSGSGVNPEIRIESAGQEDFVLWMDTVVTGFMSPDDAGVPSHESFARDTLEEVLEDMAGAVGFVRYLAFRGELPAGAASMRLQDEVAQLSGASTLPDHRRRGIQTALLARRLSDAREAGCEVAVVTTQPGSSSQKNAQRHGFQLLYTRAILVMDSAFDRRRR